MSFLKKIFKNPIRTIAGVATLGGSEVYNEATKGGLYGEDSTNLINSSRPHAPKMTSINATPQIQAQLSADQKKKDLYGSTLSNLGGETEGYVNTLRGNLTKNVAKADQYQNQAGRDRGIANARAGLSGVDTSAADEQSRRNAIYGAAGLNEAAQRQAQDTYGKSISSRITGSQQIENSELAKALGQVPTPVANTGFGGNGFLSGLSDLFSGII